MEGTAGFITRNVLAQNVPGGMQSSLYSGGYAVVSVGLGKENRRMPGEKYEILKSILPRGLADELLVDVRDDLRAPHPEQRPPGKTQIFASLKECDSRQVSTWPWKNVDSSCTSMALSLLVATLDVIGRPRWRGTLAGKRRTLTSFMQASQTSPPKRSPP